MCEMSSNHRGIYRVGMKFDFLGDFLEFWSSNSKKRLVFSSNSRIHIQTIKFEFKWTNQELTTHYRPPSPVVGGTARALPPSLAPVRAVPPGLTVRYPCRPRRPPRHLPQALPAPAQAVAPPLESALTTAGSECSYSCKISLEQKLIF